jgi:glycosyltransferase involved in cell wall biosynthesis
LSSALKILQMVQTLDPSVGGVAPAVLALSGGLSQRGHKIDIVTLDEPHTPYASHGPHLSIHALGRGLTSYRYSGTLAKWLRDNGRDYDRVMVHGLWQYLSFAVWRRFRGTSTPYYVFPHGMLDPWFKRTFPLKHLKKWLYWPWADYRVLRDAAAVIFTSEEERIQAGKSFWLYRCREKVSPLGIETPSPVSQEANQKFLTRYAALRNRRVLLFLGRLHPKKGCDLLIDAFARHAHAQEVLSLVLAGPDQVGWQRELRARAVRLGIASRVVFAGMLEGELKHGAFASAEAFILPSHQENFGMSVVEALAIGLPVLISNRVNIWREVNEDRAGFVENDDLAGTSRLIERWIDTSPTEREAMQANAQRCFASRFEINRAVDSLLSILNEER